MAQWLFTEAADFEMSTQEAIMVGGPNHILPTGRHAIRLARAESLEAHARSIAIRLNEP
jgi:histidinol dehydrogenase